MNTELHRLLSASPGTSRTVTSLHFGHAGGQKVYLQASLHADELPGMLVLHHLRQLLVVAESKGLITGEVVIVPVANPIGLSQRLLHHHMGRFDLVSGENFNRRYPDFFNLLHQSLESSLGQDAKANVGIIRSALKNEVAAILPRNEFDSLRKILLGLALDADVVLDLHCDAEALLHLYTEAPCWPQAEKFCRLIGVETVLLARGSGAASFDESCSGVWWQLAEHFAGRFPVPQACFSATVELRGQASVDHVLAVADAGRIFNYLIDLGVVKGVLPLIPPLACSPTPLAGSQTLIAPISGVIAFHRALGDQLEVGDAVVDVVDPITGDVETICSGVAGRLYARENRRFAAAGMDLCKIAGATPFRTGPLLGA